MYEDEADEAGDDGALSEGAGISGCLSGQLPTRTRLFGWMFSRQSFSQSPSVPLHELLGSPWDLLQAK